MHSLLEDYLAKVAAHLSAMPAKRCAEELREMRTHLENAVIVNREMGQTEDEAAQNAVAQFGTPQDLGENVVWAWRRGVIVGRRSFWGAAALALALTFLPNLPIRVVHLAEPYFLRVPFEWEFEMRIVLLLLPSYFVCGVLCGFAFPRRAVAGTMLTEMGLILLFLTSNLGFLGREFVGDKVLTLLYVAEWVLCPLSAILGAWVGSRSRLTWKRRGRLARR